MLLAPMPIKTDPISKFIDHFRIIRGINTVGNFDSDQLLVDAVKVLGLPYATVGSLTATFDESKSVPNYGTPRWIWIVTISTSRAVLTGYVSQSKWHVDECWVGDNLTWDR